MLKKAPIKTTLGKIIRELRHEHGFTQEKLAELAEIDRTYIYRLESGKRLPSLEVVFRIAKAFNITPGQLIDRIKY